MYWKSWLFLGEDDEFIRGGSSYRASSFFSTRSFRLVTNPETMIHEGSVAASRKFTRKSRDLHVDGRVDANSRLCRSSFTSEYRLRSRGHGRKDRACVTAPDCVRLKCWREIRRAQRNDSVSLAAREDDLCRISINPREARMGIKTTMAIVSRYKSIPTRAPSSNLHPFNL